MTLTVPVVPHSRAQGALFSHFLSQQMDYSRVEQRSQPRAEKRAHSALKIRVFDGPDFLAQRCGYEPLLPPFSPLTKHPEKHEDARVYDEVVSIRGPYVWSQRDVDTYLACRGGF